MRLRLLHGNCIDRMAAMPESSVDEGDCDPPYGLRFMSKAFDDLGDGVLQRLWHREWLKEAFRVIRPGGRIKAFCGTRTHHHLAQAMEDVGFVNIGLEAWAYGSGFPKSLNVGKQIDKMKGAKRETKKLPYSGNMLLRHGGDNTRPWMEEALKTGFHELPGDAPATPEAELWDGWGTALKPAWEPVLIGFKPVQVQTASRVA